ncbi:hypothetical protein F2P56_012772 [Juglans regia]|uniref:Uncharacterized protein LOC109019630 n=2 Tax=Juglans regia TaxID=51240 RepID=A0A2I4HMX8_JUGRE|nr:uncharacterized protein LOC109019630 [Juglans regia]KAF5468631.1 hypothetical protein F2P56_012772 [Juglans regia]
MGWDPDTKTVIASDEYWANTIRVKSDWKYFQNAGCPKYVEFCTIFGTFVAIGTLHHSSAQLVPTSDEERLLDVEMRSQGLALGTQSRVEVDIDDIDVSMGIPSTGPYTHSSRWRQNKGERIRKVEEELLDFLGVMKETNLARQKCYEERGLASLAKHSKGSTPTMDINDGWDPFAHCVELLHSMQPKLPYENFFCAFNQLRDPIIQQGFLAMNDEHSHAWAMQC